MPKPIMDKEGKYPARSSDMLEFLGLDRGAHLPKEGIPEQLIQGVRIYVIPLKDVKPSTGKSSQHRIMAICGCGRHMGFSRLKQHICHMDSVQSILGDPVPPKFQQNMTITSGDAGLGKSWKEKTNEE